MASLQSE
ncbi:hypothetical protein R3I93_006477 [Phoxinus phoxinus]